MDKNKRLQAIPKYSIDRIGAKSELATRGLRELGLLKDEKHFTIIYVCQFCGRLINYASTPCIFCGNFPKTKREVLIAHALSSTSLEMSHLIAVSKAVKNKEDLEIIIANLRQLVDDILKNENKFPIYKTFFRLMDDLVNEDEHLKNKRQEILNRSKVICERCGQEIKIADIPCLNCATLAKRQGAEPRSLPNTLTPTQKWIVAVNSLLTFIENDVDMGENEKAIFELIFVSVYILNQLVEGKGLPDQNLKNHWKDWLRKSHYFGSYRVKGAVEIVGNKVTIEAEENQSDEGAILTMALGTNLSYLLKS